MCLTHFKQIHEEHSAYGHEEKWKYRSSSTE